MKTASALIVAAALAAGYVQATSSGKFIFTCNALSSTFGCDPDGFDTYRYDFRGSQVRTNGATSRNGYCRERAGGPVVNASQEMHWAFKAVRSDNYRVVVTRGGEPESSPVTSYRPGELLDVHVRVMQGSAMAERDCAVPFRGTRRCYDFMDDNAAPFTQRPTAGDHRATAFRGLMMHFQQSSDANAPFSTSNDGYDGRIDIPGDIGHAYFANATNGLDAPSVPGWELNGQEPPLFHLPSDSCGDEVLFHATGGYKATYNKFHYRAPAAGTGPLALRVLLKTGDANWGWFWFPNMAGDVVLSEGAEYTAPENNLEWVRGEVGQSCDDVCGAHTIDDEPTGCDEDAFARISSPTSMMEVTAQGNPLVCQLPILSGCGALGPKSSTDGMCFYAEANCAADRDQAAPSCEAFSADPRQGRRLCPCNTETVNSASSAAPSVLIAAVAAVAALGSSSRMTLVIALALALAVVASPANAHNWLRSKSRAAFASTAAPFPPRTSDSPHVMVAFDQKFQVEWVVGHSRETYWLITHSSHLGMLQTVRDADLDQYIADRPASQNNLHLDVSWRRWHRRRGTFTMDMTTYPSAQAYRPETTNDWRNSDGTYDYRDFFASNVRDDAAPFGGQAADDRITRDSAFSGAGGISSGRGGVDGGTYYRLEYRDADLSLDGRAKYTNPTWPWILEVARCEHNANQPSRPDVLNFAITMDASDPTRTPGPGHYLANWRWRGYYDMVDIDVVSGSTPVPQNEVYGTAYADGAPFRRVDHAIFANPREVWPNRNAQDQDTRCTEFLGSAEAAIRRCNRVGSTGITACDGVNIWPLYVPSTVSSDLITNGANGFNPMIPWGNNASYGCNPADFNGAPAGTRVMAAVASRMPFDDRVPGISISEDPEDLVWHSVAFAKDTGRNFTLRAGSPFLVTEPDLSYHFGHKCVDNCADLTAYEGYTVPPMVPRATNCRNCDLEPATPTVVNTDAAPATEYFMNSRCGSASIPSGTNPTAPADYKLLTPRGTYREMLSSTYDCAVLTERDPDCSDIFVRREGEDSDGGRACFCLRNSAAPCDRVNDGSHTVFQINSNQDTQPDPTCARGQLNGAGNRCCPSSCSQAECDSGTGTCYTSNTNTLACSVRGAPCFI